MPRQHFPAVPLNKIDKRDNKRLHTHFEFIHSEGEMQNCIHFLKQINCFIGTNNSGKSRCIRAIFSCIPIYDTYTVQNTSKKNNKIYTLLQFLVENIEKSSNEQNTQWIEIISDLLNNDFYVFENYPQIYAYWEEMRKIIQDEVIIESFYNIIKDVDKYRLTEELREQIGSIENIVSKLNAENSTLILEIQYQQVLELIKLNEQQETINKHKVELEKLLTKEKSLEKRIEENVNHNYQYPNMIRELNTVKDNIKSLSGLIESLKPEESANRIKELKSLNLPTIGYLQNELKYQYAFSYNSYNFPIQLNENINNRKKKIIELDEKLPKEKTTLKNLFLSTIRTEIIELKANGITALEQLEIVIPRLYIPILRGTRPLDEQKTDYYADRTAKDYQIKDTFTGLSIYKELQEHLLGDYRKRQLIREFEAFLSESFFNRNPITLIPRIESDVVYIKNGENEERPIYELGDGVQALIVLTFPLFLRKNKEWAIFIEEPEAHLHPKWQRFFIDTIKKYFPRHQFFFTTHSNIFLSDASISLYRIWQNEENKKTSIQYVDTGHASLLDELGYKASDLLNANYVLWVEGISDKFYFKQFITAYDPTIVEGVHYSIMFYGGCENLLKHVSVSDKDSDKAAILSINPNCGFFLDSDFKEKGTLKNNKKEKYNFQQTCKEKQKFCWITEVREIENLIPEDEWKRAAIAYTHGFSNYRSANLTIDNVEFIPENEKIPIDPKYHDRTKDKKGGTLVTINASKNMIVQIDNKILMAKEVVKIFPKDEADLKKVKEIHENIKELVEQIKKANQVADILEI